MKPSRTAPCKPPGVFHRYMRQMEAQGIEISADCCIRLSESTRRWTGTQRPFKLRLSCRCASNVPSNKPYIVASLDGGTVVSRRLILTSEFLKSFSFGADCALDRSFQYLVFFVELVCYQGGLRVGPPGQYSGSGALGAGAFCSPVTITVVTVCCRSSNFPELIVLHLRVRLIIPI